MKIIVLDGQTLFDIGMAVGGSAEVAFQLALENNLSITDDLTPGTILTYSGEVINQRVVNYYKNENIQPATAIIESNTPVVERYFEDEFDEYFE